MISPHHTTNIPKKIVQPGPGWWSCWDAVEEGGQNLHRIK